MKTFLAIFNCIDEFDYQKPINLSLDSRNIPYWVMKKPQNLCFFTSLLMWLASLWSLTQKGCPIALDPYSPLRPETKHLFRNWKSVTNNFSLKAFLFQNPEWVRLGFQFYCSPVFGESSEELYHGFYRELLTKGKKMNLLNLTFVRNLIISLQ